jgi:hypothetical protein
MKYFYIIERNLLENLPLNEDIFTHNIRRGDIFYNNLIEVYSNTELKISSEDMYHKLEFYSTNKTINKNLIDLMNKYIEKKSGYTNLNCIIIENNDTSHHSWYVKNMPIYLKRKDIDDIIENINHFNHEHVFYAHQDNNIKKIKKYEREYKEHDGIVYGEKDLCDESKDKLKEKTYHSDKDLNQYLDLKEEDNFYHYKDIEDIKNINKIENNNLPEHKLMRENKFALMDILHRDLIPWKVEDINYYLSNNSMPFCNQGDLKIKSNQFYQHKERFQKTFFTDETEAFCAYLNARMAEQKVVMIEQKEQYILCHKDDLVNDNDLSKCKSNIFKLLISQGVTITDEIKNLTLKELIGGYYKGMIMKEKDKPYFYDKDNKPLPLHIVHNQDKHHMSYYHNGIMKGLLEDKNYPIIHKDSDMVIILTPVDMSGYCQIILKDDNKKVILHDDFYCPDGKINTCQNKLNKLFKMGFFLTPFGNDYYHKYNLIDERELTVPKWMKNLNAKQSKELIKFLYEI